jgi:two-component system sporulation sensor kinase A
MIREYSKKPAYIYLSFVSLTGIGMFIYINGLTAPSGSNWLLMFSMVGAVLILNFWSFHFPSKAIKLSMDSAIYLTCIFLYGLNFTLYVLLFSRLIFSLYNYKVEWWKHVTNFSIYCLMIVVASYVFISTNGESGFVSINNIAPYLISLSVYFALNICIITIFYTLLNHQKLTDVLKGMIKETFTNYLATLFLSFVLIELMIPYQLSGLSLFVIISVLLSISFEKYYKLYQEVEEQAIKLRESEERYRRLVDLSPDTIMVHRQGEIVYINCTGRELLGASTSEELIGKSVFDFVHPHYWDIVHERIRQVEEEGRTLDLMEEKIIRLDGQVIDIEAKSIPFTYMGKPAMQTVVRDITKRKRAEAELRTTKEQLESFINNAVHAISVTDLQGYVLKVNHAFEKMYGWDAQEIVGQKLSVIPDYVFNEASKLHENVICGKIKGFETIRQRKDGSLIDVFMTISPIWDAAGKLISLAAISRDITERKLFERRLEESDQRYRSLVEHNPDAICSFDLVGNYLACNPAAEKMIGYRAEELLTKNFKDIVVEEDVKKVLYHFEKVVQGEPQNYEIAVKHKDGHLVDLSVKAVPIVVDNKMVGIYGIAKDITEYKRTEELLRKTDKLSVIGQLAAGVAHEIRNPLTSLKGFIQLLQSGLNENKEYYTIMLSELDRINFIVSELLLLSKPQVIELQYKDLRALLQHVVVLLETQAIMNNIQIFILFESDIPLIKCEENKIKQAFINILKNAIEAMPSGGEIHIKVKVLNHDKVVIRFIDQGYGIPEERIGKLGEPFYTTKEKGTGLGLMICYKIIEAHQGSICINSKKNQGTSIDVTLPISVNKTIKTDALVSSSNN